MIRIEMATQIVLSKDVLMLIMMKLKPVDIINFMSTCQWVRDMRLRDSFIKSIINLHFGDWSLEELYVTDFFQALVKLVKLDGNGVYHMKKNRHGNIMIDITSGMKWQHINYEDQNMYDKEKCLTFYDDAFMPQLSLIKVPFKLRIADVVRYPDSYNYSLHFVRVSSDGWVVRDLNDGTGIKTWPYQDLEAFKKRSTTELVKKVYVFLDGRKMKLEMGVNKNALFTHEDLPNSFIQFEKTSYEISMVLNIEHGAVFSYVCSIQVMTLLGVTYYTLFIED